MTQTAKPLTAPQRTEAKVAEKYQARIDKLEGQLAEAREARDIQIRWLVSDGVKPFVISQETLIPAGIVRRVVNEARP